MKIRTLASSSSSPAPPSTAAAGLELGFTGAPSLEGGRRQEHGDGAPPPPPRPRDGGGRWAAVTGEATRSEEWLGYWEGGHWRRRWHRGSRGRREAGGGRGDRAAEEGAALDTDGLVGRQRWRQAVETCGPHRQGGSAGYVWGLLGRERKGIRLYMSTEKV